MGITNKSTTLPLVQTVLMCFLGMSAAPIAASPYDAGKISEENFETRTAGDGKVYSPFAGRDYPDQVLFGDTHFHTNLSFDAGLIGTTLTVHDGFRVARGEKVISNTGQPVQLIRPLDFLAITDHSEKMGLAPAIAESNPILLADEWGRWIHERFNAGTEGRMEGFANIIENTREAIFGALRRKEVYATTGSRLQVRVFGGYDYSEYDLQAADFASVGYGGGVPMGGNLARPTGGKAPVLMVRAMRDPDGANLDRVQVIKGWLDAAGETHERIYDVAVSGGRKIGSDGRCKTPVGNSVNIEKATYTNSIGDPVLAARWTDPDFDPKESAFYYVRVLEIPTPRWTTYDAAFYGIDLPTTVPPTLQDRAYTSPIWYSP